jgi:hypothetical protein
MTSLQNAETETSASGADYEWVNDWFAASTVRHAPALPVPERPPARSTRPGQVANDIVAIERARDALIVQEFLTAPPRRAAVRQSVRRTLPDSVPTTLGTVLGSIVMAVFGAAATFAKFAR